MNQCIVCRESYSPGSPCPRCGSDNTAWELWQESRPEEQEGLRGLVYFTEPHCHMPFLVVAMALGFGLMGIAGLWQGVYLVIRLLATVATVGGCLVIIQGVYEGRHKLRETKLLALVRVGPRKRLLSAWLKRLLGTRSKAILVPTVVVGLTLLLAYALIQSDALLQLSEWLLLEPREEASSLEPEPPPPDEFRSRVIRALPLISMAGYVGFCLSLVYSSAIMLAWRYAREMNQYLPQPIFMNENLLAEVIKSEAAPLLSVRAEDITWYKFWRTRDGGAELEGRLPVKSPLIMPLAFRVVADAWGAIQEISHAPELEQAIQRVRAEPEKVKPAWDLARTRLERYFDRNLSQSKYIFRLSVGVMIVGFIFILICISLAFIPALSQPESTTQGMTEASRQYNATTLAVVGSIAGVITEFIGATFLFIHRSTIQQAAAYVKTLEQINSVGMAMQIMDSISGEARDLQDKTKAEIVKMLLTHTDAASATERN